jgi:hypothetical protein
MFRKLRSDICNFVFIAGINDTGKKLFMGLVNTGDIASVLVSRGAIDTDYYAYYYVPDSHLFHDTSD